MRQPCRTSARQTPVCAAQSKLNARLLPVLRKMITFVPNPVSPQGQVGLLIGKTMAGAAASIRRYLTVAHRLYLSSRKDVYGRSLLASDLAKFERHIRRYGNETSAPGVLCPARPHRLRVPDISWRGLTALLILMCRQCESLKSG